MNQANAMTLVARIAFVAALSLAMFAGSAWADAPTRAGRVSALDGSATVQQGDAPPAAAALNWPITSGERLVSAPGSRLELRVGATALQLDGDSTLDIDLLDDQRLELRLEHGRMALHARSRESAGAITLVTPQGRLTLRDGGRWRIEAGLAADTTTVAAIEGDAEFTSNDADTRATVPAGRLLRVSGVRQLSLQTMPLDAVDFDRWVAEHDADATPADGYVSSEMTGAEELDRYGSWSVSGDYGPIWYPSGVDVDWAPYRYGSWIWVAPWGWTWVDEAPWGFAPSHYGRWALIGARWGWVPGAHVVRPVYAPALVGWIGTPGWSFSASIGASVGWFPLAPLEPYYPAYGASLNYVRNVNTANVRNVTRITEVVDVNSTHYANRAVARAVTVVPAAAMASGQPVARAAVPVRDARTLAALPPAVREPLVTAPAHAALAARPVPRMSMARAPVAAATAPSGQSALREQPPVRRPPAAAEPRVESLQAQHPLPRDAQREPFAAPPPHEPFARERSGRSAEAQEAGPRPERRPEHERQRDER